MQTCEQAQILLSPCHFVAGHRKKNRAFVSLCCDRHWGSWGFPWPCRGAAVVTAGKLLVTLAVPWATSLAACSAATGAAEHTAAPLLRRDAAFQLREIAAKGVCYPQEPLPAGSLSRTPRCRWAEVGSSSVEYDIVFTSRHSASPLLSLTPAAPRPGSCS